VIVSVVLAFGFGYALTMRPLRASGLAWKAAFKLALAADTISIAVMEVVDNAVMLLVPGAMEAGLHEPLFWGSLAGSLLLAGIVAFPVNGWLLQHGRGHALVQHAHH
jgi:hypothetical protein